MQNQTFKRYIVWGALAAVAYLMLLQWDKDYGTQTQLEKNENNIEQITQNKNETNKTEDLPVVEVKENIDGNEKREKENKNIVISNDVMEIKVNLEGGDITNVTLLKHAIDIENPDKPITLLEDNINRTYVAQSGLMGKSGPDSSKNGRPIYQSEKNNYQLEKNEISATLFFLDENGNEIKKIFTLEKESYLVKIEYQIQNNQNEEWEANLFAQIKRDNTKDPFSNTSTFGMNPFLGIAYWSEESKYNKISLSDIKEETVKVSHKAGWLAFVQHYFLSAWIAPTEKINTYTSRINSKNENIFGFVTEKITIAPSATGEIKYSFYAGPKDQNQLREISSGLELTVDYGWLWMVAQTIFWFLLRIQEYVVNWGWSIVLLTCLIKALFFPLNQYAFKSMANMRKLQPKMQRLKELYGDDRQKLSQATMEMYRKEKINPLGSCLPMLIQMPVFIALYWVLSESVELRHAEFIFWIKDLSIKDPYFVLPGLMAISMFIQQKLSPMVFQDPTQEKIMKMMPFMFAVFFLFFPAGLVLYWLVNNILTILQQWFINKQLKVDEQ